MKVPLLLSLLLCSFLTVLGQSFGSKPLFIEDIHVTGTRTLDSTRLNEIIGPLNQVKIKHGSEEISERLRALFQEFGYFDVDVKSISIEPIDPLESLPRVHIAAEVSEGMRYRIGDILFKDIHVFEEGALRSELPVQKGEYFSRGKVGSGLEQIRKSYGKLGYLDCFVFPETTKNGRFINLILEVHEGHQYRLSSVQFAGNPESAERLRARWALEPGQPVDVSYIESFFKENETLFPPQFNIRRSLTVARNCKENTAVVFFELSFNHPSAKTPSESGCS